MSNPTTPRDTSVETDALDPMRDGARTGRYYVRGVWLLLQANDSAALSHPVTLYQVTPGENAMAPDLKAVDTYFTWSDAMSALDWHAARSGTFGYLD